MRSSGDVECLDARLVSLARGECALRLRLGQLLEVLGRGAVFDLGFSSVGAYAVERCERSVRWAEAARCLARRVEALPELRREMASGKISWTMGEVLARVATAEDESRWLALAEGRTVRQVRLLVEEAVCAGRAASTMRTKGRAVTLEGAVGNGVTGAEGERALGGLGVGVAGVGVSGVGVSGVGVSGVDVAVDSAGDDAGELCTLACTVDREDAWLFEATRCLLDQLGERSASAQVEAMLAEAQATLLSTLPRGAIDGECLRQRDLAQERWLEQRRREQAEAELCCEARILAGLQGSGGVELTGILGSVAVAAALGIAPLEQDSCTGLDRQVRSIAAALARHELDYSELVLRFHRAGGWLALGYATEAQYARERLGLSRSSFVARRALALRLERLPRVAAALGAARIGVEAALQLVRVATPNTEAAWVDRARRRTIKHLREEVAAALVAVRWAGELDCPPPEDAELAEFQALERAVVSGRLGLSAEGGFSNMEEAAVSERVPPASVEPSAGTGSGVSGRVSQTPAEHAPPGGDRFVPDAADTPAPLGGARRLDEPVTGSRRAWCVMLGSLASWLRGGLQMSAAKRGAAASGACSRAGRVTIRLRVWRDIWAWWRGLEDQARRWLPPGTSWLRFVCLSVWQGWSHMLGTPMAYGHIYIRDRFRCTSPVCMRRDVTPHHIQFRSSGGSDDASNLTSPCSWCHLHGVHGGRIRVSGTAERMRWELGPKSAPAVVVEGRERYPTTLAQSGLSSVKRKSSMWTSTV